MNILVTVVLATVLALIVPVAADALTLNTAPLSEDVTTGTVRCVVSNVSAKTGNVTVEARSFEGGIIAGVGFGPTPLGADAVTESATVDLTSQPMGYCRCIVPNKSFRCSLVWGNGTSLVVIPGQ